jgi:hypothetical protein
VDDRPKFDRFVAERSPRLVRAAYLMCRGWTAAEDLPKSALRALHDDTMDDFIAAHTASVSSS